MRWGGRQLSPSPTPSAIVFPIVEARFLATDDGSYGEKGFVTATLQALLDAGRTVGLVLALRSTAYRVMVRSPSWR